MPLLVVFATDLKLEAADGTVLLQYVGTAAASTGWIGGCTTCSAATVSTYANMTLTSCVDKCSASLAIEYRGGDTFNLVGDAAYSNEWIYLDQLTQAVTLSAVGCTFPLSTLRALARPHNSNLFVSPRFSHLLPFSVRLLSVRRVGLGHRRVALGLPG